jgi:hypothetical protein
MTHYRNNGAPAQAGADAAFEAMQRHHAKLKSSTASLTPKSPTPARAAVAGGHGGSAGNSRGPDSGRPPAGDILYGARDKARRRVYNLLEHYRECKTDKDAGFFKPKGGLCLSISKWRKFHGLD